MAKTIEGVKVTSDFEQVGLVFANTAFTLHEIATRVPTKGVRVDGAGVLSS
jgi:hypothetical protein